MLEEVLALVERLNGDAMTEQGETFLHVEHEPLSGTIQISLGSGCLWDSECDDREDVGICQKCGGSGNFYDIDLRDMASCPGCGGTGKDEPKESLETYVRRQLRGMAISMLALAGKEETDGNV